MKHRLFLLIIITFFASTFANLQVYIPECAKTIISSEVNYTLSNFGYIPYGESFIGQVFKPKGQNNSDLCTIQNQPQLKSQSAKTFLLVKRGNCKFTQKVLNGQKLGADFVIVYDNRTTDKARVIMKNDGHGHLITIPSIFISKKDGNDIQQSLTDCTQSLYLKQVFDVFESQIVDLSLWLNLNKRQSYILLRDFYKYDYYNVINAYTNINVRFKVNSGCRGVNCDEKDCIGKGQNQYCFSIHNQNQETVQIQGSEILKESLRMYLLFYLLPQAKQLMWFQYMDKFDENDCIELKDIESCSYEQMKEVGISNDMIQGIKNNITLTLTLLQEEKLNQNSTFYLITEEADVKNILFYPEAVINGKNFYGLFKAPEVFQMICNSLLAQPKQCYSFIKNKTAPQVLDKTDDLWLTVFFIILLMTLGFLVALFVYTRLIKRELNQQMSMQVNKMVQNYVNLADQKSHTEQTSDYQKITV